MKLVLVNPEYSIDDLYLVAAIVKHNDLFILGPSNVPDEYDVKSYIIASQALERDLRALVDNNLITRAISLARGARIPPEPENKKGYALAAATMAFLIAADFLIEPSMSIYEKASKSNHEAAKEELFYFRVADHVHVQQWINIALERQNQIEPHEIDYAKKLVLATQPKVEENNFHKILNPWKVNYYFILKAAALWKNLDQDVAAAEHFIRWMADESFFNAASMIFSLIYLSPKRYRGMIKGIESTSKERFHNGLKNAAWDLAYITQWSKYCREASTNTLWLLCSNDLALRAIARWLYTEDRQHDPLEFLLSHYWDSNKAKQIVKAYQ